jgi:hypothetical protein
MGQDSPTDIHFQFKLRNLEGDAITSAINVEVAIYDAKEGGDQIWPGLGYSPTGTYTFEGIVPDASGVVALILGPAANPADLHIPTLGSSVFGGVTRYLELTLHDLQTGSSETLSPRLELIPYGPTGPSGVAGETGPMGSIGLTGLTGDTGAAGPTGSTGAVGPVGPMGPVGATGAHGPEGAVGQQGPVGETGAVGATGSAGETGATGAKGDQGLIGPVGPVGETGAQGEVGPAGSAGDTGAMGVPGVPGPEGAIGPVGPRGETGSQGVEGQKGSPGPEGHKGDPGPQGPEGIAWTGGAVRDPTGFGGTVDFSSSVSFSPVVAGSSVTFTYVKPVFNGGASFNNQIDAQADAYFWSDVHGEGNNQANAYFKNIFALGTKSFVQPNPENSAEAIVYKCMEGPNATVEAHGRAKMSNGVAFVELPPSFRLVADPESITVLLTPHADTQLFVEYVNARQLVIRERAGGRSSCDVSWQVMSDRVQPDAVPAVVDAETFFGWLDMDPATSSRLRQAWLEHAQSTQFEYEEALERAAASEQGSLQR